MTPDEQRHRSLARWYEAIMWLYAFGLAFAAFILPEPPVFGTRASLYWIAGAFAAFAVLYYRVMPPSSERGIRYRPEDKSLLASLTVFLLLTAYLLAAGRQSSDLIYLYLLPLFAGSLLLEDLAVVGGAVFVLAASLFLRETWRIDGTFFDFGFSATFAVLSGVSVAAVILARELGISRRKADSLSAELSRRLDQMQTVGVIVKQVEYFTRLETLLSRLSAIIAGAFDAERGGILLNEESGTGGAWRAITSDCSESQWLEISNNANLLKGIIEKGEARIFGPGESDSLPPGLVGDPHLEGMIIAPLRARETTLGAVFAVNKRSGGFVRKDLDFLEILAGYVSTLVESSLLFRKVSAERENAERMSRLMVGRELQMKELKKKIEEKDRT